jgi:hypothetical protein
MAGFSALGLGLALGAIGGTVASRLRQPKPGATADQTLMEPVNERPTPIDANRRSSDAAAAANQARIRQRRRTSTGTPGSTMRTPRSRVPIGRSIQTATPQVEPRTLIGY